MTDTGRRTLQSGYTFPKQRLRKCRHGTRARSRPQPPSRAKLLIAALLLLVTGWVIVRHAVFDIARLIDRARALAVRRRRLYDDVEDLERGQLCDDDAPCHRGYADVPALFPNLAVDADGDAIPGYVHKLREYALREVNGLLECSKSVNVLVEQLRGVHVGWVDSVGRGKKCGRTS